MFLGRWGGGKTTLCQWQFSLKVMATPLGTALRVPSQHPASPGIAVGGMLLGPSGVEAVARSGIAGLVEMLQLHLQLMQG